MGWWSAGILGGDTPLDVLGDIADVCGSKFDEDNFDKSHTPGVFVGYGFEISGKDLVKNLSKIQTQLKRSYSYDPHVPYQVLGYLFMKTGTEIPGKLYPKIYDAVVNDEWATEGDSERMQVIQKFSNELTSYMKAER